MNRVPDSKDLAEAFVRSAGEQLSSERSARTGRLLFVLVACLLASSAGLVLAPSPSWPGRLSLAGWFVAPALAGLAMALFFAGQFITQLYSLSSLVYGIRQVLSATLGLGGSRITAKPGEIEFDAKDEASIKIGGPGRLSVKAGTAVITERGAGFGRMLGPGEWALDSFERVRAVFDLRTQVFSAPQITLTKDGIPVRVNVSSSFKLSRRTKGERAPEPIPPGFWTTWWAWVSRKPAKLEAESLPVSAEALRIALYDMPAPTEPALEPPWRKAAHGTVSGEVQGMLAALLLDQLFEPQDPGRRPRSEISQKVLENARAALAKRGIDLIGCGFDNIVAPPEVIEQWREAWRVNWEKTSTITQAYGEAEGLLQYQRARAEAQAELLQAMIQAIGTQCPPSDETGADRSVHPLAMHFIDVVVRAMDRKIEDSSRKDISQSSEDILKQLLQEPAGDRG